MAYATWMKMQITSKTGKTLLVNAAISEHPSAVRVCGVSQGGLFYDNGVF
jgi:hypothetical protein